MTHLPALLMLRDLLLLRANPLQHLTGSWGSARRSFFLWLIALPAAVAATYIAERPFIAYFHVSLPAFCTLRLITGAAGLLAGFLFAYVICRFEKLQARFALFVESQNWIFLASALLSFGLNFATRDTAFLKDDIVRIAITQYIIGLVYLWYATWRALGGNPFYAAGIVTAMLMPSAFFSDVAGLLLYGQARPFFDPSIPTLIP